MPQQLCPDKHCGTHGRWAIYPHRHNYSHHFCAHLPSSLSSLPNKFRPRGTEEHFYHPKLQQGCSSLPFCQRLLEPPSPGLRFPWRSPYSPKRALLHCKGPPVCLLFFLLIYLQKLRAEMLSHWSPPIFSAVCFLLGVSP